MRSVVARWTSLRSGAIRNAMVGEFRRSTRWGWQQGSRGGDGTAAVILLFVVAVCFFGTILLLPFGGAGKAEPSRSQWICR